MKTDTKIGEIVFAFNEASSALEEDIVLAGAREAGYTLDQLGFMFGVTREWVRQRVQRVPAGTALPKFHDSDAKLKRERRAEDHRSKRKARRRILGLRMDSPVMNVPVETLNELRRLHELVSENRGWTPLDAPSRLAVKPFGDLLWATIQTYEIPQTHLERAFGLGRTTLIVWLRNHGYLPQMPSQKSYQGVVLDPKRRKGRRKALVPGGKCRQGHVLSEKDIVANGTSGARTCRICKYQRAKDRYQQRKASAEAVVPSE